MFEIQFVFRSLIMTIYLVLFLVNVVYSNKSIEYLHRYGYVNEEAIEDSIVPGVKLFQETFNLTVDGTLNNETIQLMESPRCGNKDNVLPFTASPKNKWLTNEVTWYMYGGVRSSEVVERAFNLWSKHANITFRKQFSDPMIYLSISDTKHMCYSKRDTCKYDFDGSGGVLAHAFIPTTTTDHTDVHFDYSENWDYSMNIPNYGFFSFYLAAIHEIGHAIGLYHSSLNSSIMYPYAITPTGIQDMNDFDLSPDDILAIQFLYGRPVRSTSIPTTSSTTSTTSSTTTSTTTTTTSIDICTYRNEFNHFLVFKDRLYVFHNKLVWVLPLDQSQRTKQEYTSPKVITDWLTFLPKNFSNITAVYQRPNDEIVLISDLWVYYISTPYLTLLEKKSTLALVEKPFTKISAAVSTNQGKTFLFVDDWYVMEINECSRRGTLHGPISQSFPGIPNTLVGGFRYINGKVYFQTRTKVLEFDEFKGTVTRSIDEIFDFIGINCIRESLLTKLYQLIKNL